MGLYRNLYGSSRWRKTSERFRKANPLCVRCKANGLVVASQVADHVTPHKGDESSFWTGELQALCKTCHDLKSIVEDDSAGGTAQTHPEWLPKPACPVILVCGAPGAGKTTWAKAQAGKADTVIDLDDCFTAVCGVHGHKADREFLRPALRYRNKLLANLAQQRHGKAYVIVGAPTQEERQWWADKLGATVHLVDASLSQIQRQAIQRIDLAVAWYEASRKPWRTQEPEQAPKVRMVRQSVGMLSTARVRTLGLGG